MQTGKTLREEGLSGPRTSAGPPGGIWISTRIAPAAKRDGKDDWISTPFVVNPADGPFSVFAWVKGGAAGQVIISQATGANWLMADSPSGALLAELRGSGRNAGPALASGVVTTDGQWHRVGLVWDGSKRMPSVDDVEVARDITAQGNLTGSTSGLYIGAGSKRATGTFWSGLIDDVRIYNRAVKP